MTTPEPSYRTIQLTQGQIALVSPHRFEELNAHNQISGKGKYLGLFSTPDAAFAAYCMAAKQLHGDFAKTA
jgi:hypothetical protein